MIVSDIRVVVYHLMFPCQASQQKMEVFLSRNDIQYWPLLWYRQIDELRSGYTDMFSFKSSTISLHFHLLFTQTMNEDDHENQTFEYTIQKGSICKRKDTKTERLENASM